MNSHLQTAGSVSELTIARFDDEGRDAATAATAHLSKP